MRKRRINTIKPNRRIINKVETEKPIVKRVILPRNFNFRIYQKLNPDLTTLTQQQLVKHYLEKGYEEGRKWQIEIPIDFDWKEYQRINNLRTIRNEIQAKNHFLRIGFLGGLKYSNQIIEEKKEEAVNISEKLKTILREFKINEVKWTEYIEKHKEIIPKLEILINIENKIGKIDDISKLVFDEQTFEILEEISKKVDMPKYLYITNSEDLTSEILILSKLVEDCLKIIVSNEPKLKVESNIIYINKNYVNLIKKLIENKENHLIINNLECEEYLIEIKNDKSNIYYDIGNLEIGNVLHNKYNIIYSDSIKYEQYKSFGNYFLVDEYCVNISLKKNYEVEIISLFYNNSSLISEFEKNIIKIKESLFILIDNNSEDDTYEKLINLGKKYDNIKVIKNIENGCASGRNLGLEKVSSQTKYVLFLDSDHIINDKKIIEFMKSRITEDIKYVGYYGGTIESEILIAGKLLEKNKEYEIKENDNMYLGCGCSMVDYKFIIDKNINFDKNFDPFSVQDVDFSYQIKKYKKLLKLVLNNEITHYEHATTSQFTKEFKRELLEKNSKYFIDKYKKDEKLKTINELGVNQIHISKCLKHLERIKKIFNLDNYKNSKNSLIIFGLYDEADFKILKNNIGNIYLIWGGTDEEIVNKIKLDYIKASKKIYNLAISKNMYDRLIERGLKNIIEIELDLTDYSVFKPIDKTGNKIFIYNGYTKDEIMEKRYGKEIYEEVIKRLPEYEYVFSNQLGGIPNEKMYDIYKECFIGLRLTEKDGNANMVNEMKAMGIPVIHNLSEYGIKWETEEDIVRIISQKSGKLELEILNKNPIDMYKITKLDNNMLGIINSNIEIFNKLISNYRNILFICGDNPGYGGAATNCSKLQKYYTDKGHNTLAFYYSFEKESKYEPKENEIIGKINDIFKINFKPDLIILKSFIQVNLKEIFKCPIFYLVGGIYKNNLDKYYYDLKSKKDNDMYINEQVLQQIKNSDYSFSNSYHTQEILKKFYDLKTYLFYCTFVPFQDKVITKSETQNRKYDYGLIVSNFNRKIKNIETSIDFLKDKENVILIGKESKKYKSLGFTCIDLVNHDKMEEYYRQIKTIIQDSYYESCSNVKIESLFYGCYLKSVIVISSTQYPGYGGAATNAYKLIKYFREKKYKVVGIFFTNKQIESNTENDIDRIGGVFSYNYNYNLKHSEKRKIFDDITEYLQSYPNLCLAKNIIAPIFCKEIFNCFNVYLVSGINHLNQFYSMIPATEFLSDNFKVNNNFRIKNEEIVLNITDKIVFNSQLTKQIFLKIYGENKNIKKILKNVIDTTIPENYKLKNYDRNIDILVCSSNLKRKIKNNYFLLDILNKEEFKNLKKVFVGEEYNDFKNIKNSEYLGLQSNYETNVIMKQSKILLFPSLFDSNPNTVREAYFNGCLPLITRNIGFNELFPDYLICNSFEISEWISKIKYIFDNYESLKYTKINFSNMYLEKMVEIPFLN